MNKIKMAKARKFAEAAHTGQVRKGNGEPYINHPFRVADAMFKTYPDSEMYCAAVLHDVVEDADITIDEIIEEFGTNVASLVYWLTTTTHKVMGNRELRKSIDLIKLSMAPIKVQIIKLYDIQDNLSDIDSLDKDFAIMYKAEKKKVIQAFDVSLRKDTAYIIINQIVCN